MPRPAGKSLALLFPEITLRDPFAVPPTIADPPEMFTPATVLPTLAVPAALRPMKLPSIKVPLPLDTKTPEPVFPEMTFPAPAAVPPMVLLFAPSMSTPLAFGIAAGSAGTMYNSGTCFSAVPCRISARARVPRKVASYTSPAPSGASQCHRISSFT